MLIASLWQLTTEHWQLFFKEREDPAPWVRAPKTQHLLSSDSSDTAPRRLRASAQVTLQVISQVCGTWHAGRTRRNPSAVGAKELSPAFQGWVGVEYNLESRRDDRGNLPKHEPRIVGNP